MKISYSYVCGSALRAGLTGLALLLCTSAGVHAQNPLSTAANQDAARSGCAVTDENSEFQRVLAGELRRLRAELLEYRIEIQAAKVAALQRSIGQIQAQRQRLLDEERSTTQQFTAPEPPFSGAPLNPAERAQLESLRSLAIAEQATKVRTEQADLATRESTTNVTLRAERQRLEGLQAALGDLTGNR